MNPLAKKQKVSDETPEPVSQRNVTTLATAMTKLNSPSAEHP
jgi:hypothetical protein